MKQPPFDMMEMEPEQTLDSHHLDQPEGDSGYRFSMELDPSLTLRELKQRLAQNFERAYLQALLEKCDGNVSRTARQAGLDRVTLHRIIRRLGLRSREPRD